LAILVPSEACTIDSERLANTQRTATAGSRLGVPDISETIGFDMLNMYCLGRHGGRRVMYT